MTAYERRWQSLVDFVVMAPSIYLLLRWSRDARALRVMIGIRITRVGALLPLSQSEKLPRKWGTRHRAAMGLAERSDAVVVVASEESGDVTLMHDGAFRRVDSAGEMLIELRSPQPAARSTKYFRRSELLRQGIAIVLALIVVAATRGHCRSVSRRMPYFRSESRFGLNHSRTLE